jgi:hypothetical protein
MIPPVSWKAGLCLAGVIVATALSGALIGHAVARKQIESRNNPETWNEHVTREFERIVQPTPEQGVRIQSHLDRAVVELQAIRRETIARSTNVIGRLVTEVERELTPEQKRAFETMKPKPSELTLEVLELSPAGGGR